VTTKPLSRFAGMSVLVVDDNQANVEYLRQLLDAQGLDRVHLETDPRDVAEDLAAHHPDLVLLDLHMPHVDGFGVLAQIKRFAGGHYLPVLVMTADTTTSARNRALAEGAQDFLTKPVDATEATLRIANLLETRRLYAALRGTTDRDRGTGDRGSPEEVRARLQRVIDDSTLAIALQPVVDLRSLDVVGYEGLSRFPDPQLGGPDRWFADAFAVGMGVELEWFAAETVLAWLEHTADGAFVAINMSPATALHLGERDLCPPELCPRLVIELTEHVPIEDYPALHRSLETVRRHGARLSADDVGSGYAGFRHLLRLQPDVIKLDISLVAGIHRNRDQQALARALLSFAADVGAEVVAEGIEEGEELEALQALGIPFGQGYHLGRPMFACEVLGGEDSNPQ
jgi:EAL domain-containing protein (putative c-di-GMP-specific phosphodiesterase class I)/DNA-binding NarL/FixJ family response regulator